MAIAFKDRRLLIISGVLLALGLIGCTGATFSVQDEIGLSRPMTSAFLFHLSSSLVLAWFARRSRSGLVWLAIGANVAVALASGLIAYAFLPGW